MNQKEKDIILNHISDFARERCFHFAIMSKHSEAGNVAMAKVAYHIYCKYKNMTNSLIIVARELGLHSESDGVYAQSFKEGKERAEMEWKK